jgi:phytoene synthase
LDAAAEQKVLTSPDGDAVPAESLQYCARLTRTQAGNFYYGMKLMPEPKRSAMYALYAYLRLVDDIADADHDRSLAQREADLTAWRRLTHAAVDGRGDEMNRDDPRALLWPAFSAMVRKYRVPVELFDEAIAGQVQDLEFSGFETFEELKQYCYRVAGVVGLASLHVWGFEGGEPTERLAVERGLAFQLTNILRDLREDAHKGRVYLPRAEVAAAGLNEKDLDGGGGEKVERFLRQQIDRTEAYYRSSSPLEARVEPDSRATLATMTEIYHGLLEKMAANPLRVMRERVSLSLWSKLRIGWKAARGKP